MKIESYSFGNMVIQGQTFSNDLIILPHEEIIDNWWRKQGHKLLPEDLNEVINSSPDTLIVGQGASGGMTVATKTKKILSSENIELISSNTRKAYKIFNQEQKKNKKLAGAFHLTC